MDLANPDISILHEAGKASGFARRRPLKGDRSGFLPLRFSRIGGIVRDVADLRAVQRHLQSRSTERDVHAIPALLLAKARKLFVAGVEPQDVASDGSRMHAMDDDPDEFARLATPEVDLIAGAHVDAAVVGAGRAGAIGGVRLLGEHEFELELEILEQLRRHQTAAPFAGLGLSTDDRTVFNLPWGGAGLRPAGQILAVEEWPPSHRRLRRQRQRQARKHERFHGAHSIPSCETIPHQRGGAMADLSRREFLRTTATSAFVTGVLAA